MAKDPTPKADMLRAQREQRYGHIQATASEAALLATIGTKKIPYAGKPKSASEDRAAHRPVDMSPEAVAARKAIAAKRKPRKKRTVPPEGKTS
jgi:hypothetical protein